MRRSVDRALEHWRAEGLLDGEQIRALAISLERMQRPLDSARAARVFGFVGAVLAGLGTLLFVGSNWDGMSPPQRTLVLLAWYGATVAAAVLSERRGLPLVAEAVWLLSTLVLGANIFLVAQSYNLSLALWQGTLAWLVGTLAMAYARRSAAQVVLAVPLAILTLGWAGGGSGWFFDDQAAFLFADSGLRPLLPLMGLALVALSTLLANRSDLRFGVSPCFLWGMGIVAATLILTTGDTDIAEAFYRAAFSARQLITAVGSTVLVVAAVAVGRFASPYGRAAMGALLALLLAILVPIGDSTWVGLEINGAHVFFGLYVLAVISMALLTVWLGIQARNPRLVNTGMASVVLIIVIQYFGWSFDLLDRSAAFILGGFALIALAVVVERNRRRIMLRMAS